MYLLWNTFQIMPTVVPDGFTSDSTVYEVTPTNRSGNCLLLRSAAFLDQRYFALAVSTNLHAGSDDVPVAKETAKFAQEMIEVLHSELYAYYMSEFPGQNYVRRIAELMRFMQTIQVNT